MPVPTPIFTEMDSEARWSWSVPAVYVDEHEDVHVHEDEDVHGGLGLRPVPFEDTP